VVNVDDSFGCQLSEDVEPKSLIRYSVDSDDGPTAEVKLLASEVTANGQNIHASTPLGEITAVTALLGDFNAENTLACIATLLALGLDYNQSISRIPSRLCGPALVRVGNIPRGCCGACSVAVVIGIRASAAVWVARWKSWRIG
jgi:hypothetical protein